jgi:fructokinase
MNMKSSNPTVVCFGEILWDNLPTGRNPGGAPMNVAYHLNRLGVNAAIISALGDDEPGRELLRFLKDKGVSAEFVQVDPEHQTSEVSASVSQDHEVSYVIHSDVAWDYILADEKSKEAVAHASAFVFGSLSARNLESRETLFSLLAYSKYNVFDVNLRAPHYSPELIKQLMQHADLLKVNASELQLIAEWHNCQATNELEIIQILFSQYKMTDVVVTKGSTGASLYTRNAHIDSPAYQVPVQDTIGSGDSFLAALLAKKLSHASVEDALDHAVAMGAFITGKSGACPEYNQHEFERFMKETKAKLRL